MLGFKTTVSLYYHHLITEHLSPVHIQYAWYWGHNLQFQHVELATGAENNASIGLSVITARGHQH